MNPLPTSHQNIKNFIMILMQKSCTPVEVGRFAPLFTGVYKYVYIYIYGIYTVISIHHKVVIDVFRQPIGSPRSLIDSQKP